MTQITQVKSIVASETPINFSSGGCRVSNRPNSQAIQSNYYAMDEGAAEVYKLSFLAGGNFPANLSANTERYVLVNEVIAKYISPQTPTAAVGKTLWVDDTVMVQIAGILKNFRPMGPHLPASRPMMVRYLPKAFHTLAIRIQPGSEQAALKAVKSIWAQNYPEITSEIYNYDERNDDSANRIISLFEFWGTLVIVIACLGLFGMVAYALEIRTKELGIRRVLGAQYLELMWLISKSFVRILVWAGIIGVPFGVAAGFLLQQRMGETVDLGVANLSKGFALVLLIGMVTVLLQVWRVRKVKAVESLKME
jgi:putative ABC transport system permease protein